MTTTPAFLRSSVPLRWSALSLLLAVGAFACGGDDSSPTPDAGLDVATSDTDGDTSPDGADDADVETSDPDASESDAGDTTEGDTAPALDTSDAEVDTTSDAAETSGDVATDAVDDVVPDGTEPPDSVPTAILVSWSGATDGPGGSVGVHRAVDGSFAAVAPWLSGDRESSVPTGNTANLVGDFNGDGNVDLLAWSGAQPPAWGSLLVAWGTPSSFAIFENVFAGTQEVPVMRGASANLAADVNGDGLSDLLAVTGAAPPSWGGISVMLSTGTSFSPNTGWLPGSQERPVGVGSTALLAGDVTGDGRADVVTISGARPPSWGSIGVAVSTGTAFEGQVTWHNGSPEFPTVFGETANLLGDVDGDGLDDLIVWTQAQPPNWGGISVYRSTGTTFEAAASWYAGRPETPVVAGNDANLVLDVNGDGLSDLVAWTGSRPPSFGGISVFLSNGTGFDAPTSWRAGAPGNEVAFGNTTNLGGYVALPAGSPE